MATGGKPYYLAGLLPALLGAGAVSVDRWLERGRPQLRKAGLATAIGLSALVGATVALPVLPDDATDPVVAMNEDVGETIGWPELAETVAEVHRSLPDPENAVIVARNYGEAGALERFGPDHDLPAVYSGHNAYADWGPPPDDGAPVIAVALAPEDLAHLSRCREAATIENDADVDNDEQGARVMVCAGPDGSWSDVWPELEHLG
jgi:hypothetical protein